MMERVNNEVEYTASLRQVLAQLKDEGIELFDFDYPLLSEYKEVFETLFIKRNLMREIGFTSIGRFKHELEVILLEQSPKYNKLIKAYEVEIDPLLSFKTITKGVIINLAKVYSENRFNDTPNSKVTSIKDGYLTSISDGSSDTNNESTTDQTIEGFQKEQIELLDNYRQKMYNIYVDLLNELDDLFLKVY